LVLSAPRATIDLAGLRSYVASRLGDKARVSTLHDMLVLDVDRDRLVEVATFVRDDARTRCDLYSVNAGVDTGAELVHRARSSYPHPLPGMGRSELVRARDL